MTATPTIGQTSDGPIAKNVTEDMTKLCTKFHTSIIKCTISSSLSYVPICSTTRCMYIYIDIVGLMTFIFIIIIGIAKYFIVLLTHGWCVLLNDAW